MCGVDFNYKNINRGVPTKYYCCSGFSARENFF